MSVAGVPHRLIGRLFRQCAAPFGMRALGRMLRDGLSERLRAPLEFLFTGKAAPEAEGVAERIERRRADIAGQGAAYRLVERPTSAGWRTGWNARMARRRARTSLAAGWRTA